MQYTLEQLILEQFLVKKKKINKIKDKNKKIPVKYRMKFFQKVIQYINKNNI